MTMEYRTLGRSGLQISAVSFGGGPISGLMVGTDGAAQQQTIQTACDCGINWFDTAATYGDGRSEQALGTALHSCSVRQPPMLATKVRLLPEQLSDIPAAVHQSFAASLRRLQVDRVQMLQLHNSVTTSRGDLPTSVTVNDVLGEQGVLPAFEQLRRDGLVEAFGFTGLGDRTSLQQLITAGVFASAQVPLNLLTPFTSPDQSDGSIDVNYVQLAEDCHRHNVGIIAIRVFAGGALTGRAPSPHTRNTKFFTLDIFERDQQQAQQLLASLPDDMSLSEASLRFVLSVPGVSTALLGLASRDEVIQAHRFAARGPLGSDIMDRIRQIGTTLNA